MRPAWYARWRLCAALIDALFIGGALVGWTAARFGPSTLASSFVPAITRDFGRAPLAFAIPSWLLVFAAVRLYSPHRCQNALEEGRRLVTAAPVATMTTMFLGFLVKENPARSWLGGALVLTTIAAVVGRQTLRVAVARARQTGAWMTRTVVVGGREAKSVLEMITSDRSLGIDPVATCGLQWPGLPSWQPGAAADAVRTSGAGQVLIVPEGISRGDVRSVVEIADELPINVIVLPGLDYLLLGSLRFVTVGYEPALALEAPSLHPFQQRMKRAMDVAVGSVLLVLTAPLMLACAVAVRLDSRGPVFFRHLREGYKGQTFEVLKFRTMEPSAPLHAMQCSSDDPSFFTKPEDDPRVTRVGRFLRRTSLDELPQLWNVVKGDMSLVGPRPLSLWEAEQLSLGRRMLVRPGLSGLWQVSGRSSLSPEERVRLDLVYVQNWSMLLDLSILLRTVPAVIGRRGAY